MYLLTLHISAVRRIKSEKRMIFLGEHHAKYWPPTMVCAVCVCVCILLCQIFDITAPLGNEATILHLLSPMTLQVTVNSCNASMKIEK